MKKFEISPIMVEKFEEIVFLDDFVRNVREFDADRLRVIKEIFEMEVSDVEADEFCAGTREDAVDLNLEGFN